MAKKVTKINKKSNYSNPDSRTIAKEIIDLKFVKSKTLGCYMNQFYAIMRKHKIKQGTPCFDSKRKITGTIQDNYEWTMLKELFISRFDSFVQLENILNVPKDLER